VEETARPHSGAKSRNKPNLIRLWKSAAHSEPNNGSNSLINVTLCRKKEANPVMGAPHAYREVYSLCWALGDGRSTAVRECTEAVIVLAAITAHLRQMIPHTA
jgi:hypothetical protein